MNIAILYFSATGNTKYISELVQKGLKEAEAKCDIISITSKAKIDFSVYDLIGFASPVFAYKPALSLFDYINKLPQQDDKLAFIILTYAGLPLGAFYLLRRQLQKKRLINDGTFYMLTFYG